MLIIKTYIKFNNRLLHIFYTICIILVRTQTLYLLPWCKKLKLLKTLDNGLSGIWYILTLLNAIVFY